LKSQSSRLSVVGILKDKYHGQTVRVPLCLLLTVTGNKSRSLGALFDLLLAPVQEGR